MTITLPPADARLSDERRQEILTQSQLPVLHETITVTPGDADATDAAEPATLAAKLQDDPEVRTTFFASARELADATGDVVFKDKLAALEKYLEHPLSKADTLKVVSDIASVTASAAVLAEKLLTAKLEKACETVEKISDPQERLDAFFKQVSLEDGCRLRGRSAR